MKYNKQMFEAQCLFHDLPSQESSFKKMFDTPRKWPSKAHLVQQSLNKKKKKILSEESSPPLQEFHDDLCFILLLVFPSS